jgi:oligopeptide transport system substrate-binding protein
MTIRPVKLAALLACAFSVAACSDAPDNSRTLHRGNSGEPLTLDPHKVAMLIETTVINDLFEGLYTLSADGRAIPGLALTADVSDDRLTWRFQLRETVWSDGHPLTAGDVAAGMQRAVDPATLNEAAAKYFFIENAMAIIAGDLPPDRLGVIVIDDYTLEIRLDYPVPYVTDFLAYNSYPLPRHVFAAVGDAWVRPEHMVTNGPYTLTEWRSVNFIELSANPNFHASESLCFDTVFVYPTTDRSAAERRVRSGELDLNVDIEPSNIGFLRANHSELLRESGSFRADDFLFNTTRPPFDDVRVRQAFSLALDRRFLAENVLGGAVEPSWRMISPALPGSDQTVGLDYADTDMDVRRARARTLLVEAGYGPDNPLDVMFSYVTEFGRSAPVIQQDISLIAPWVSVEMQVSDSQLHYAAMRAGDFMFGNNAWMPEYPDPYGALLIWETRAGDLNYSRWSNADYDRLVDTALRTVDAAERTSTLGDAERILLREMPHMPLYRPLNFDLVRPDIIGWTANPTQQNPSRWLCRSPATDN